MIDLHLLRQSPHLFQEACRKKRIKLDISAFLELDAKCRSIKVEVESLRSQQNTFSKEIPKLSGTAKEEGLHKMKEISTKLKESSEELRTVEEEWKKKLLLIPSIPSDKVPEGDNDSQNVEIRSEGKLPEFSFTPKDHIQLGAALDLFDIDRGVKIAGSRNYFLKGNGVRLQHAILKLALDLLHYKGYTIMDPPHIVKYEAMMGTGYFPGGEEQAYQLDQRDEGMFLIGTSEVSVCSYHLDEILDINDLPIKYAGYSPCYRREAGTYGKDTQGLYRIHQFYKVEQVVFCKSDSEESARMHQEILSNAEQVMKLLELPYRVVDVCSGDMGQGQVYKNDIETWMPSRGKYGETHSCSTFHEFQARRLNIRYKNEEGKNVFCHTLNNTCVASPRILIPFLEIHQQADGSIHIPAALRPYMGGEEKIVAKTQIKGA